jgi:hypothetical protein
MSKPRSVYHVRASTDRAIDFDTRGKGNLSARETRRGLAVVGWVTGHNAAAREVELVIAGNAAVRAPVDLQRPDVAEHLGSWPHHLSPGFHVILEPDRRGTSEITVYAVFEDDSRACIGQVHVEVRRRSRPRRMRWRPRSSPHDRRINWTVLSPPAEREKVLHGKDGWLFLRRDTNDVIGQQTGRVKLSRGNRRAWVRVLRHRAEVTERMGTVWQSVIIPDKEFVYPEHLPADVVPARRRPVDDVLRAAEIARAPVAYALDALQRAKSDCESYPKTDSHWNQHGSFVAYQMICDLLKRRGLAVPCLSGDQVTWSQAMAPGGLGMKLYPAAISQTTKANLNQHNGHLVFDNRVRNHGRVMVFSQPGRGGLSCVVFGESFVQNLVVFLKESFRRLVYVHTSMLITEILAAERPDVVLSIPLERFLIQPPDDGPGLAGLARNASEKARSGTLAPLEAPFLRGIPRAITAGSDAEVGTIPWASGMIQPPK